MDNIVTPDVNFPQKQCYACDEIFPATTEFFGKHAQMKDGLQPRCKTCHKTRRNPRRLEEIPEGQKRCSKCKNLLPATPEFFTRHRRGKGGLSECCKECKNSARRNPPVEKDPVPEGMKRCPACDKVFPATDIFFTKHPQKIDGLNPACKVCRSTRRKTYKSQREYQLRYERENRKEITRKARIYRKKHKDRINEQQKRRMQTEKGKMIRRAASIRRKARKRAVIGTLTHQQIQAKLKAQKYRCYYAACGYSKFERKNGKYIYHIEHTIPLSRAELKPRHDTDHIVLACPACNLSKHDKAPWEWSEGGRLF